MSGIFVADAALDNHTVALADAIVSTIEVYAAKNSLGGFSKTSLIESDIDVVSIARTAIICGMDVKPESWREDYELDGEVEDSVIHAESAFTTKVLSPGQALGAFKKAGVAVAFLLGLSTQTMIAPMASGHAGSNYQAEVGEVITDLHPHKFA